jgi:hypothetical protein
MYYPCNRSLTPSNVDYAKYVMALTSGKSLFCSIISKAEPLLSSYGPNLDKTEETFLTVNTIKFFFYLLSTPITINNTTLFLIFLG